MAIDLRVQYFSHLNGLNLNVAWGSLLSLYDTCLVTGLELSGVVAGTVVGGDLELEFLSNHQCLLFQIVELRNFQPEIFNTRYRVVGVLIPTKLVLKGEAILNDNPTVVGQAKLSPLGYETIFSAEKKRVYRAKSASSYHPYIRMDETITDGSNVYNANYSRSLMIGLIEDMVHIDDYENPDKLQLPPTASNLKENWQIVGAGTTVVRGRCKHYWGMGGSSFASAVETTQAYIAESVPIPFTLVGDEDAVYVHNSVTVGATSQLQNKALRGFGIMDAVTDSSIIPPWFLMVPDRKGIPADTSKTLYDVGGMPLSYGGGAQRFLMPRYTPLAKMSDSIDVTPIMPDNSTGRTDLFSNTHCAALQIPVYDSLGNLRGTLKHVCYSGNSRGFIETLPLLSGNSMYVADNVYGRFGSGSASGESSVYHYLGELE